jgi:hypothetical protein
LALAALGLAIPFAGLCGESPSAESADLPRYAPPPDAREGVRVDVGLRGKDDTVLSFSVLAPDHVGWTTKEQPSLFWYQSRPVQAKFELSVVQENQSKPVFAFRLDESARPGIQRLRLSEHDVRLQTGVEYEWVVALVFDPTNRSQDIIASGLIKRVNPPPAFAAKLPGTTPAQLPFLYASAGIWYDAVEALADLIEAQPENRLLRRQRASLLEQVKLSSAAAYDIKLASGR